jgi:hypothetical protein
MNLCLLLRSEVSRMCRCSSCLTHVTVSLGPLVVPKSATSNPVHLGGVRQTDEFTRQNDAPRGEAGQVAAVSYRANHDVTVVLQFGARIARTVSGNNDTL